MKESSRKGYVVIYPNRDKAASKLVRLVVSVLLVVSALIIALVTVGGWSKLDGLKPLDIAWILLDLILAFYVFFKWSRGALTFASALGLTMLFLALIAASGAAGTNWSQRGLGGYAAPHLVFGGKGFGPSTLNDLVLLLVPVEAVLLVFALFGFRQAWNIEKEVPKDEVEGGDSHGRGSSDRDGSERSDRDRSERDRSERGSSSAEPATA